MREFARLFYQSKSWKGTRKSYFNYKYGLCERCGKPGNIVHHKIHLTPRNINNVNITLSFDNLELLCRECHGIEHEGKVNHTGEVYFDEKGNVCKKLK